MEVQDIIAGRYHVLRAIGRGGMGTVWLCRDEILNREVAIKQIGAFPGEPAQDAARAMREARVAAALNHENAVSIYDVVEHDDIRWLVMEHFSSKTLAELVREQGRLPVDRVATIGAQVAAALATAHGLGIVHRDIKPGNILVSKDDVTKISDFGIARGHTDMSLTQTGMVTGTPAFFAPELARGHDPSFASDVWAFGATLYTATEGTTPYPAQANPLAMLSMIAREPPPEPQHAGPLADAITAMLDRDPGSRWTMERARRALAEVSTTGRQKNTQPLPVPVPASAATAQPVEDANLPESWTAGWLADGDEPPAEPPRRRPTWMWLAAAVALVLIAATGLLGWLILSPDPGQDAQSGPGTTPGTTPDTKPAPDKSTSRPPSTSTSKSPKAKAPKTAAPNTSAPTESVTTSSAPGLPATGSAAAFVTGYYNTVPGNLDAGWAQLSPSYQAQTTRSSYDNFWGGISSVDVSNVREIDPSTVAFQIVYTQDDGSTSTEQRTITVQPDGDSYLITGYT